MADYLIDQLKINTHEFRSRLFWRKLSTDIYGKAIRASYLSRNVEDAFYFMEKNKSLLLIEDIAHEKFKQAITLSPEALADEQELKIQILKHNILLSQSKHSKNNGDSIKGKLLNLEQQLLHLQDSLGITSKHFNLEPNILELSKLQKGLKDNEMVMEYHISIDDGYGIYSNKENGYLLSITSNNVQFYVISHLSILKKDIVDFIHLLKTPFQTLNDKEVLTRKSYAIYSKLFPSSKLRLLASQKKLSIITDNFLSSLPFEVLSTTRQTASYLIADSEISYLYSNSFQDNVSFKQKHTNHFLGVAPVNFLNPKLSMLPHTEIELKLLSRYFNGDIYLDQRASKKTFLANMGQASIIHLATHANAKDSISPWIAFYDDKITLEELYHTKNRASLVVLSACNTSIGKQEVGEGIMSLARGFFYSGSQSVVSSLWNVNDKATSEIMASFYKNLRNGELKSKALRNAKLSYLENHSLSESSPYYWASFILLGEDNTLNNSLIASKFTALILLLFIVLGCLKAVYIKK